MRFQDTSLDPYLRFFEPRLSPFTTAVASGTVRVARRALRYRSPAGQHARSSSSNLKLFDYALANDGPIELSLNNHVLEIGRLRVAGDGTRLQMGGSVQLHDGTVAVEATGEANLGILQGFFRNLRSRGTAALLAEVKGPLANPQFSGSARICRRTHPAPVGAARARGDRRHHLVRRHGHPPRGSDRARGRWSGRVRRAGRPEGFAPRQLNLTAVGEQMRLRYPEGLPLERRRGPLAARRRRPRRCSAGRSSSTTPSGRRRFEVDPNIFDLAGGAPVLPSGPAGASGLPLRFDIQVTANNTLRVQNNLADIVASADLRLQGTYDRPADLRPRRGRPRQHPVRGQPLRRHARHDRLPHAAGRQHRAAVRHRGGNAGPRRVAERSLGSLPRHARRDRNAAQLFPVARLRSAAARGRHHRPAVRSDDRRLQRGVARAQRRAAPTPPNRRC